MWFPKLRRSIMFSFIISIVVNIGMWFERFVIIVTSLHRDYLPSSWTMFSPTFVDIGIFIGTIGFFFVLFLLYARTFPVIAQAEVKTILKSSGEKYKKLREAGIDHRDELPKVATKITTEEGVEDAVVKEEKEIVEEVKDIKETSQEDINSLLGNLGTFDAVTQTADDLKKVNGIGPVMEQKLNEIGIYTFAQVSKMTEKEYNLLDSITGSFPGRAQRDDWAGQAEKLKNN